MDKIILSDCRFSVRLGVTAREQAHIQPISMDLELFFNIAKPGHSDALSDTINYSAVHTVITDYVCSRPFHLIEALAEQVAQQLLQTFPFKKVLLRVKKPNALKKKNVAWAGVEITRP